ncbi:MAG: superoxide dismutase family protein [Oscillospiraceae bacterium]|nr:superoxide dismutase family protein [Oscillospiraceae bacterium]
MYVRNGHNTGNFASLLMKYPHASAELKGNEAYPNIYGTVRFYQTVRGVLISAEVSGLPYSREECSDRVFGFHIHEGVQCGGDMHDPFSGAMSHYNPDGCRHPFHAGDLPVLFGNKGYAFSTFLTDRFSLSEVIGRTVIIHSAPDDFTSQPSGNAGEKLACGVILSHLKRCR